MSEFFSVADYTRELATLDQLIAMRQEFAERFGLDRATESTLRLLRSRREELAQELEQLKAEQSPGHEVSVIFTGEPVHGHAIDAGFLGNILNNLQDLLTSIVGALRGNLEDEGRFSKGLRRVSSLRFAGAFEGSFGMRLEAVDESLQLDGSSPIAPAIESFIGLIEGGDSDVVMERLAEVGGRAAGHFRSLLGQLSKRGATMEVIWPGPRGVRQVTLTNRRAGELAETLTYVEEKTEGHYVWGVLNGALKRKGYFELQADSGEVYSGSISPEIMQDLRDFFDRRCRAFIVTTEVHDHATNRKKTHHRLLELAEPEELTEADDEM